MGLEVYVIEKLEARINQLERRIENLEINTANFDEYITTEDLGRVVNKLHPEIKQEENWWNDIWA